MATYRVILLAPAAQALEGISDAHEHDSVKHAAGSLGENPDSPANYAYKKRREGWELYVGRWKITYEIHLIELVVYVHNIKERPSLRFDYRY